MNITEFAQDGDPAKADFFLKLQEHLLGRILGQKFDGDDCNLFNNTQCNSICFRNNTIFRHLTARINYTSYDICRDYDTINPHTHPFVMVASPELDSTPGAHPFWYAQVLGIFHVDVQHVGPHFTSFAWRTIEFLWVRWLGVQGPGHVYTQDCAKLPKLAFVPSNDEYAYGFLDPAIIICGCHIIPGFNDGKEGDDWASYYVNV